jgi:hypothetical protein
MYDVIMANTTKAMAKEAETNSTSLHRGHL